MYQHAIASRRLLDARHGRSEVQCAVLEIAVTETGGHLFTQLLRAADKRVLLCAVPNVDELVRATARMQVAQEMQQRNVGRLDTKHAAHARLHQRARVSRKAVLCDPRGDALRVPVACVRRQVRVVGRRQAAHAIDLHHQQLRVDQTERADAEWYVAGVCDGRRAQIEHFATGAVLWVQLHV